MTLCAKRAICFGLLAALSSSVIAGGANPVKDKLRACGFDFENYRACWNREMKGATPQIKNANVCSKCAKLGVTVDDQWPHSWQVTSGYRNVCAGGQMADAVTELEALVQTCLKGAAPPVESNQPDEFQFFSAMGLSINMCAPLAAEVALQQGWQPGRAPANAPDGSKFFVDANTPRARVSFRSEENDGGLELVALRINALNRLDESQITAETERIKSLYGQDVCRKTSKSLICQGNREVGPYDISLRADYGEEWVQYTFRNQYRANRVFEASPQCLTSLDESPAPLPQPAQEQTGQEMFEQARALDKAASAQGSPTLQQQAIDLYEAAAAKGHPGAMFNLSRKHAKGEGVPQDTARELELLESAAQAGLPEAQYELARKHAMGSGVPEDQEKASELLEGAAEGGDADSQLELAKRKLAGQGTAQSDEEAMALLKQSAENGNAEAQFLLGRMLEQGVLAPLDLERAEEHFCMAAGAGYGPALDKCRRSTLPPNDTAKAGMQILY